MPSVGRPDSPTCVNHSNDDAARSAEHGHLHGSALLNGNVVPIMTDKTEIMSDMVGNKSSGAKTFTIENVGQS